MTARLVLGIDVGVQGGLAALADARFVGVSDLPMRTKSDGKQELDGHQFSRQLRDLLAQHPGARVTVILERVSAMPPKSRKDKPIVCKHCRRETGEYEKAGMGVTSAFNFGEGFGRLRGILEALDLPVVLVVPHKWKKDTGLTGTDKDYSRTVAMQCYPTAAALLQRKKDDGRAEALLLARWGDRYEAATGGNLVPDRDLAEAPELALGAP